jgi:hypothetical protein
MDWQNVIVSPFAISASNSLDAATNSRSSTTVRTLTTYQETKQFSTFDAEDPISSVFHALGELTLLLAEKDTTAPPNA